MIKKLINKFNIWSLYYRQEIVWFIVGFILGVIVI
jgi:hypothetical protein